MSGCLDPCNPCPPPPAPPPGAPPPPPPGGGGAGIGPDGVKELYPTVAGGTKFYLNMSNPYSGGGPGTTSSNAQFNISYGTNSQFPFTKKTGTGGDPPIYFNTTGSPISYASGNPPGRSVRLDLYPDGGKWNDTTSYSWESNPGYLYTPAGIGSCEHTTYIRPHGNLGTHQAYAHKINGRDEDAIRSLIEICHADTGSPIHNDPYGHWNYAHFPYDSTPINIVSSFSKLTDGKWLAGKAVHKIAADRKSSFLELWEDSNPFDSNGRPANNWKLVATIQDNGDPNGYGHIPCTWKCQKQVMRIDGYQSVDFTLISDREIDITATASLSVVKLPAPIAQVPFVNNPNEDNFDGTLDFP